MSGGRHIGDCVWRSLVRRVRQRDLVVIEGLWDIMKCYEHIVHCLLVAAARALGYPMAILRVSVSSYLWPRFIFGDYRVVATPIYPVRGIVAGSAFALDELAAYTIGAIRTTQHRHPMAGISLHVDDFAFDVWAKTVAEAVRLFVAVATTLLELVQRDLELPFS